MMGEVSTIANVGSYIGPVLPRRKKRHLMRRLNTILTGEAQMPAGKYHHARVRDKKDFIQKSFRTITLKGVKGVKLISGKLKKDGMGGSMIAQRYMFHGDNWTEKEAKKWMKDHDKKIVAFEPASKEVNEVMNQMSKAIFDEAWSRATGQPISEQQVAQDFKEDGWTMEGSFEDLRGKISEALKEDGDFGEWPQIIGTYPDKVYVESYIASQNDKEPGERKFFEIQYEIDEEGDITIGDSTELTKRTQFLVKEQAENIVERLFRISPSELFVEVGDIKEALRGVSDLPDSSFGYIESGGKKDSESKTTPRKLRHYPMKDAKGNWEKGNVVNALVRLRQADKKSSPWMTDAAKAKILAMIKKGYKSLELEFPEE